MLFHVIVERFFAVKLIQSANHIPCPRDRQILSVQQACSLGGRFCRVVQKLEDSQDSDSSALRIVTRRDTEYTLTGYGKSLTKRANRVDVDEYLT